MARPTAHSSFFWRSSSWAVVGERADAERSASGILVRAFTAVVVSAIERAIEEEHRQERFFFVGG